MATFTLDTSGLIDFGPHPEIEIPDPFAFTRYISWTDLDPFTQGYVEALFGSFLVEELFAERAGWSWSEAQQGWIDGPGDLARDRTASEACHIGCIDTEPLAFSDLSPEALALILKDCAADQEVGRRLGGLEDRTSAKAGRAFWKERQSGSLFDCPPLTVSLGDDGKVHLAEAA